MSKSPNGENSPVAEGSHFSNQRDKRWKDDRDRSVSTNAIEDMKGQPEDLVNSTRSGAERSRAETRPYNAHQNKRARHSSVAERAGAVERQNSGAMPRGNKENFDVSQGHGSENISSIDVGYGYDAKAGKFSAGVANTSPINRRPGRKPVSEDEILGKEIEYPPKPNRRRRGLDQGGQPSNSSSQPDASNRHKNGRKKRARAESSLYAALDLGTNNCRLLVALPQQSGRFRVVDGFSRIVRLGKGMESSGRLDDSAMTRAVEALGECAKKLKNLNIKRMRLIATEACRRAENGQVFLDRVRKETGLDLEIVNRETEAHLAAEGCGALVDKKADGAVLFDIGGGSSELILLDRRGKRNRKISEQVSSWTSLPTGVVTLSERHGGKHVSRQVFDSMVEEVEEYLAAFEGRENLAEFWHTGRVHLLGTSGTVTTLAGVHLKLARYDRRQVDGIWLNDVDVDQTIEQLIEMEYHQRAANPCIGQERADLVLAGCAILQAIRKTWPSPRLRVADRGLREGILTQLMNQDAAWTSPKKGRRNFGNQKRKRR